MIAIWARQSSAKLPRCGMMKRTSGYSRGQELDDGDLAHHVVEHRQRRSARATSQISRVMRRVVAVHLDAAEAVALDRLAHSSAWTRPRSRARVDEREAEKPPGVRGDDLGHLAVGDGVVGVEGREEHGARDPGLGAPGAGSGRAAPRCPTGR